MKFINKVMVFVMGLVVIGVVSTTIGVVTQPKNIEKSVTFELLENDMLEYNVFDKLNEYAVYNNYDVTNLVSISSNDYIYVTPELRFYDTDYRLTDLSDNAYLIDINSDNTYTMEQGLNVGDIISITFDVEVETPVIIKTLLVLIPLVLSAGLIGYLVVKKGDE